MKTIALSDILVSPTRQRRVFAADKMDEFSDNIAKHGILHPIIIRVMPTGELFLVAGERRMRAVQGLADLGIPIRHDGTSVPLGHIPYTLFEDLDPLAAEEAELDENLHRINLTWQEESAAIARLASLRARQATAAGQPAPTHRDIAAEVRGGRTGQDGEITRRQLILADHLGKPEVKAAKTIDEAWKLLKRGEEQEKARALGERVGRTFTADSHRAIHADSLSWLAECQAESFDVILTDPPYGMGADEFGDSGGLATGAHGYKDTPEHAREALVALFEHSYRIAKPQAHLYCFCDIDFFRFIKDGLERVYADGWWVFRTPLIWYKRGGMRAPWPEHGPQRKYECILYAVKGKRNVLKMGGDVLEFPPDPNLGHAAQKPVALFRELLSRSCRPGDAVLDPFCGSGTVFPAAHELKCVATGVEVDQSSYGLAVKRIEELKQQMEIAL